MGALLLGIPGFLLKNWRLVGVGLLALVLGVQTMRVHHAKADLSAERVKYDALVTADKAAQKLAQERLSAAQAISVAAAKDLAAQRAQIASNGRTIIKRIHDYVPAAADAQCIIPRSVMQLHDAAAAGLPGPAGEPDPAPSGIALSTFTGTVAENYTACLDIRAEALKWRSWYPRVRAALAP